MLEIFDDVVYVRGAQKGAIYNFLDGKIYWISSDSCDLIEKLAYSKDALNSLTSEELKYINQLQQNGLYQLGYQIHPYNLSSDGTQRLELAWLEITQACNCKCLHCYQGNEHIPAQTVLSLEDWRRAIYQLSELNVSRVVVIGGEPCVHKDLYAILSELCKNRINTTLFTNATIINSELMHFLIQNRNLVSVKVSLYGDNPATHDLITQSPGSFDQVVANVKRLTSQGVTVDVAVVAMRENQDALEHIGDFARSIGANYSKFDVIRNVFGGTQDQHTPTNPEIISSTMFCRPKFKANKARFIRNSSNNSCWYGKIAITETGDVLPCVFERKIVYGNIRENHLQDILLSDTLKKHWNLSFDQVECCRDCEFRYACKDCRPLGLSVQGSIATKNPRCKYDPYSGQWGAENE